MTNETQSTNDAHTARMKDVQAAQRKKISEKKEADRGFILVNTGDGKGKSSSAFGMAIRSLGYDYKVGIVQFIKGEILSGEEIFIRDKHPEVAFYQMGTGFTWNTQDRDGDIAAAETTWQQALAMLQDESLHLVVLDEITYMLAYKYLDEDMIINAINNRPTEQTVVLTGRGGGKAIRELADTVSEITDVKHAFRAGIKARKGVDF